MNGFTTTSLIPTVLDPHKRVNYTLGLVLGVDEFVQEQMYHIESNRLHHRLLHGYGTVCGLRVTGQGTELDPQILVAPGTAVDPQGQPIHVGSPQCAHLNDWLAQERNREAVEAAYGAPPGLVSLYVVLCYRECLTDQVPIPGSPCRTEEDSTRASRLQDDFDLRLVVEPPAQPEEELVTRFGELLDRIQIDASAVDFLTAEELADLVRGLAEEPGSPPVSQGSPPNDALYLHPDEACALLQHAMYVWVTEVRPCRSWTVTDERCVRLAHVAFDVHESGGRLLVDGDIVVDDETDRPILLDTRLLQEWLACRRAGEATTGPLALDDLIDVEAPAPGDGDIIRWDGDRWVSAPPPGGTVTDHGALTGLGDDDHTQYLRTDGTRALTGDLSAGNQRITDLANATATGQALPHGQPAGGDLDGEYPNPTVVAIQGFGVSIDEPSDGQVLTWIDSSGAWTPRTPQLPRAFVGTINLVRPEIGRLGPNQTIYSEWIAVPLSTEDPVPITVAVRLMRFDNETVSADNPPPGVVDTPPERRFPNVALTIYFVPLPERFGFRVAATNVTQNVIVHLDVTCTVLPVQPVELLRG